MRFVLLPESGASRKFDLHQQPGLPNLALSAFCHIHLQVALHMNVRVYKQFLPAPQKERDRAPELLEQLQQSFFSS